MRRETIVIDGQEARWSEEPGPLVVSRKSRHSQTRIFHDRVREHGREHGRERERRGKMCKNKKRPTSTTRQILREAGTMDGRWPTAARARARARGRAGGESERREERGVRSEERDHCYRWAVRKVERRAWPAGRLPTHRHAYFINTPSPHSLPLT